MGAGNLTPATSTRKETVKKFLFTSLLSLALGLVTFQAQAGGAIDFENARMYGLGTSPQQVEDLDLIWLYPNKVLEYAGTADFRLENGNGGTNEWGGVIWKSILADGAVQGIYVNRPFEGDLSSFNLANGPFQSQYNWYPVGGNYTNNIIDAFWAQPVGGADLGLHLNYGEDWTGNDQSEQWELCLGLGFADWAGFDQVNLHPDYGFVSELNTATGVKDHGIWTAHLGVLGETHLDNLDALRLYGELRQDANHFDGWDFESTTAYTGAALVRKVLDGKGLVVTGLDFDYAIDNDQSFPTKYVNWFLFWNGGVELQVADWLTLRAGLAANVVNRAYMSFLPAPYTTSIAQPVNTTAGFSIDWQNFTLNAAVDIPALESQIAGVQPGRGLFFAGNTLTVDYADLKYKF